MSARTMPGNAPASTPEVGYFAAIDRPDTGPIAFAGPPYVLSGQEVRPPQPAPLLGQHNADIYCDWLGYTKEELVKLYQTGII